MKNVKLIVIDGVDGSGKETQVKLLHDSLVKKGFDVLLLSFPNYNSPSSELFTNFLKGDITVNFFMHSAAMAVIDRGITMRSEKVRLFDEKHANDSNGIIICDRYRTSSFVYDTAEVLLWNSSDDSKSKEISYRIKEIWNLEKMLIVPDPDINIILDIKRDDMIKILNKRKEESEKFKSGFDTDIYETDYSYLNAAASLYRNLNKYTNNICILSYPEVRPSIESIHKSIETIVLDKIKGEIK